MILTPTVDPRAVQSSATEIATNAKWYQIVAEKMRVSPISNIRPYLISHYHLFSQKPRR